MRTGIFFWVTCLSTHAYAQIVHCQYFWVRHVLASILFYVSSFLPLCNSYSFFFIPFLLFISTFHFFFMSLSLSLPFSLHFSSISYYILLNFFILCLSLSSSFFFCFFLSSISSALLFVFHFYFLFRPMRQCFWTRYLVRVMESTEGHCITKVITFSWYKRSYQQQNGFCWRKNNKKKRCLKARQSGTWKPWQ
jgi:hypothetical protein